MAAGEENGTRLFKQATDLAANPLLKVFVYIVFALSLYILKDWHAQAMEGIEDLKKGAATDRSGLQMKFSEYDLLKIDREVRITRLEDNYKRLDESLKELKRLNEKIADQVGVRK